MEMRRSFSYKQRGAGVPNLTLHMTWHPTPNGPWQRHRSFFPTSCCSQETIPLDLCLNCITARNHLWYVYSKTSMDSRTLHTNEDSQIYTCPSRTSAEKIRQISVIKDISQKLDQKKFYNENYQVILSRQNKWSGKSKSLRISISLIYSKIKTLTCFCNQHIPCSQAI